MSGQLLTNPKRLLERCTLLYRYSCDATSALRTPLIDSDILALSKGCISTEADVWLYNGTLYVSINTCHAPITFMDRMLRLEQVGHDESSLTEERTLESLYINPILDTLKRQNPTTKFVTSKTKK